MHLQTRNSLRVRKQNLWFPKVKAGVEGDILWGENDHMCRNTHTEHKQQDLL